MMMTMMIMMMMMMKPFMHMFKKLFNSCFQLDILSIHFFIITLYWCLLFPYSPWDQSQIGIKLILFTTFRKCYGLLGSELPLSRCQPLKI